MPWTLAEDEKSAVKLGWLPYHMQMGYNANDNVLTAASSLNWGNNLAPATSDPVKIMELIAMDAVEKQQFALGSGTPFVYRTFLLTQPVARDLAKKYKSENALEDALIATARQPLAERAYFNFYANPGSAQTRRNTSLRQHQYKIANTEKSSVTALPANLAWSGKKTLETVPVMKVGKSAILITGDSSRNKAMCVPGGGMASIKIELPKMWDKLMQEKGYNISSNYDDCGLMIYDLQKQDINAGGSGCGCSGAVLTGYVLPEMSGGRLKNVLFMSTGALMSPTASMQGESIPGVAHLMYLQGE
jgi:hypothetical protein